MDLQKLKLFFLRPLSFENTEMQPNILVMCKLLVLLILFHGFYFKLEDPFVPFIAWLDIFNSIPGVFKIIMRSLFIIAAISLFFNYWVRTSSVILGSVVILSILASIPAYFNHLLVCGCALFLAGLTHRSTPPYFLIIQLSLIYFGASINKMLDTDWWSGAFMHNWLFNARENVFYTYVSKFFPDMVFAKIMSITAISTEFVIGVMLLIKKLRNKALWFIVVFHVGLFTITTIRFGHFLDSLAIILISFLNWPKTDMKVNIAANRFLIFRKIVSFFDFDKKIVWNNNLKQDSNTVLKLECNGKIKEDLEAVKDIMLYSPMFFVIFFVIDVLLRLIFFFNWKYLYLINVVSVWSIIFFFSPYSSKVFFKNKKASI